ncbi:heat shock protein HslJ [Enterobacter mori]|jgi:heat shock protein HslJ|uniref:Heat shock protein HslJ n=1 Tax=Enterobacter mori TaxID=539813 RepID=A0A9Q7K354_9ENTR|nr:MULTISPECIES: heat shock protein HslJ [Enterobacter]MXG72422.1 heat shock protein HslJ [Escherichia coli]CAF3133318.1 Heat shock protein HslJ [Enterobacter cloacae]MBA7750519.1 heat shock protein HslJ [Enterobacter sp. RHBSTW-01064]MBT2102863.1 heat shock protein HslJ [Enterobacter mori]MCC8231663.1 heat shock protein HslJ [Enterobacter mori]
MKKLVAVTFLSLALAGCVNPGKASVQPEQLQNHRFVLENVDGKAITKTATQPEISFSALSDISLIKNITVSGVMCNSYNGQGKLSEGALTVKTLAMTRKLCTDPQLNELDQAIGDMLRKGAQVDLTEDQLTLATAEKTLMFKRVE